LEFDPDVFRGKTVFLPCDDPEWSNFTKYFAQNFEKFGLKKLISTSYAVNSKNYKDGYQPTLFETSAPYFDKVKTVNNGKIFTLTHDKTGDHKVNVDDLEWHYLEGDGDFRSNEIKKLRDESDIIITNPPFSLFREFLAWIIEVEKQFVIIGNMNAIAYKEVFPLIENDKMWMGNGFNAGNAYFSTPFAKDYGEGVYNPETGLVKFRNVCWFTNLDHGRRHQPLPLMTMADNLKFSKHKEIKGKKSYDSYDNYDAIEVPYTDSIPSDYDGVMGVPISFLNKYSPEQFEILGITQRGCHDKVPDTKKYDDYWEVQPNGKKTGSSGGKTNENPNLVGNDGKKNYFTNKEGVVIQSVYQRIFIRHRKSTK
ncbi:MAG TPA: adenine-specific methyltransferase EcoRI family protein, partial [Niabella sp.]|nr:adenine-specific methyltransferase EcoRI family protein [Niabella sp.]